MKFVDSETKPASELDGFWQRSGGRALIALLPVCYALSWLGYSCAETNTKHIDFMIGDSRQFAQDYYYIGKEDAHVAWSLSYVDPDVRDPEDLRLLLGYRRSNDAMPERLPVGTIEVSLTDSDGHRFTIPRPEQFNGGVLFRLSDEEARSYLRVDDADYHLSLVVAFDVAGRHTISVDDIRPRLGPYKDLGGKHDTPGPALVGLVMIVILVIGIPMVVRGIVDGLRRPDGSGRE